MKRHLARAIAIAIAIASPATGDGLATREVTLSTSKSPVTYGSGFVLRGKVTSDAPQPAPCVADIEVSIVRNQYDDTPYDWTEVARVRTSDTGRFRLPLMSENSANYRAEVADPAGCGADRSKRVVVRSRLRLTLSPTTTTVRKGGVAKLVAKVQPRCEDRVFLQKLVDGKFERVATRQPNQFCVAVFRRRVSSDAVYRAAHPGVGSVAFFYLGNRSGLSAVSVKR